MRNPLTRLRLLPRRAVCVLIDLYQRTLSPDHGPLRHLHEYGFCRHEPTCSQYAKTVITERGVTFGLPAALWRIVRCNPFTRPSDEKLRKLIAKSSQSGPDAVSSARVRSLNKRV